MLTLRVKSMKHNLTTEAGATVVGGVEYHYNFSGTSNVVVDEKGRISLPKIVREKLNDTEKKINQGEMSEAGADSREKDPQSDDDYDEEDVPLIAIPSISESGTWVYPKSVWQSLAKKLLQKLSAVSKQRTTSSMPQNNDYEGSLPNQLSNTRKDVDTSEIYAFREHIFDARVGLKFDGQGRIQLARHLLSDAKIPGFNADKSYKDNEQKPTRQFVRLNGQGQRFSICHVDEWQRKHQDYLQKLHGNPDRCIPNELLDPNLWAHGM